MVLVDSGLLCLASQENEHSESAVRITISCRGTSLDLAGLLVTSCYLGGQDYTVGRPSMCQVP